MGRPRVIYTATCKNCGKSFSRTGRESGGGTRALTYCSRECHQRNRTQLRQPIQPDDGFGFWFAGFADGEGYFYLGASSPKGTAYPAMRFVLEQREDDRVILEKIRDTLQLGRLQEIPDPGGHHPGAAPCVRLTIAKLSEVLALCDLLDYYSLRSKKLRDYRIWAKAIRHWHQFRDRTHFFKLAKKLRNTRRYKPSS